MRDADVEVQLLDRSDTLAKAECAAFRTTRAGGLNSVGRSPGALAAISAASPISRHSRLVKRQAPCTPRSVHSTSRSGGESDSMNQRATSAPYVVMMSSGSMVFFLLFDIFSMLPILIGSPVASSVALALAVGAVELDLGRRHPFAVRR